MLLNFSEKPNNASLLESVRNSLMPRRSKLASQVEWETEIENSNHSSALPTFFCPLSENHVILTHQFPSCDIIESDTVTVTSKWHRVYDDCRLMLMFCMSNASFCVSLEIKQFSKSHEKPWCVWTYLWYTCDSLCSGGVVLFELCTLTHTLLTYLNWPFCIIWHNFIYETNMPCLTNQFLAISLRSNIWEYIEPVYNPNICMQHHFWSLIIMANRKYQFATGTLGAYTELYTLKPHKLDRPYA